MDQINNQWLFILVLSLTTLIPRLLPLALAKGREMPERIKQWMSFIPAGIFAALVAADIFFYDDFNLNPLENIKLIPSALVFIVSLRFKNLFVSMITGVVSLALMLYFFGG